MRALMSWGSGIRSHKSLALAARFASFGEAMSTSTVTYQAKGVTLTEQGAQKVREFLDSQGADAASAGLRVGVRGGGCSGFQYQLAFDEQRDGDVIFEDHG